MTGTVTDATGAIVPNATITLTNTGTNQSRTATSGADGNFRFNLLEPGVYRARINAINDCAKNGGQTGGGQCEVRVVALDECAAVAASNGQQGWKIATATSYNQQLAEQIAVANNGGGLVVVSACPS